MVSLQLMYRAPISASVADDMTTLIICKIVLCACCMQGYCQGECWLQGCLSLQFIETCGGAWLGRWVLEWVELFVVHGEELIHQYLVNSGSSWVAPLEVCVGIAMVT